MFDQSYDLVDTSDILDATFLNSLWLYAKTLFSQINLTIFASQRQNVNSWSICGIIPWGSKWICCSDFWSKFSGQSLDSKPIFQQILKSKESLLKISKGGCYVLRKKLKSESELHFHLCSLLLAIMALQCKYNIFTEKLFQRKEITSREYQRRSSKIKMCSPRSTMQSKTFFFFSFLKNHFLWFTDPILFKT